MEFVACCARFGVSPADRNCKIGFIPGLRLPERFLNLIGDIRPRHPHVCQVSLSKSFKVATRPNTVLPFGEHSLQVAPTRAQAADDDAK
jgi:hypothetical protein